MSAARSGVFQYFYFCSYDRMTSNIDNGGLMLAVAVRLFRWADAIFAFTTDKLLDNPIFELVEGDHCQPSSGCQGLNRQGKDSFDGLQFLVDGDTQGLEGTGGRVQPASSSAGRSADHIG